MGADAAINQRRPDAIYPRSLVAIGARLLGQFLGCADQVHFMRNQHAALPGDVSRKASDVGSCKHGIKTQLCQHRRPGFNIRLTTAIFSGKKPQFALSLAAGDAKELELLNAVQRCQTDDVLGNILLRLARLFADGVTEAAPVDVFENIFSDVTGRRALAWVY